MQTFNTTQIGLGKGKEIASTISELMLEPYIKKD